jgi:hypothetical protein
MSLNYKNVLLLLPAWLTTLAGDRVVCCRCRPAVVVVVNCLCLYSAILKFDFKFSQGLASGKALGDSHNQMANETVAGVEILLIVDPAALGGIFHDDQRP